MNCVVCESLYKPNALHIKLALHDIKVSNKIQKFVLLVLLIILIFIQNTNDISFK